MTRALITGGAGFIGSHLAETLLARGDHVTIIDDLSTGSLANVQHLHRASRAFASPSKPSRNEMVLDRLVSDCDVIFHLAAAVGVQLIIQQPGAYHRDQRHGHGGGAQGCVALPGQGADRLDL